ncbi:uncharacterized protein LOC9299293 [Arabidopsis lyrata subsp. lyrata]|uniref:uncharacterized protein LOC9299293 n=1 Tax=Arabidopsis lyrata subsp. lyrata TaxID=81972 RepID=UPI000A29C30D|nr:uncharacterized protein LOC9299293 [Arabidopsis lyrata subsp. lyrata]|eukprot:XP_020875542.1 uncharacterized protein LOC9299293 [Arabidopsis lyrata subsp. lyrata]
MVLLRRSLKEMCSLVKKHTYDYLNQQNLKTGWRMREYERQGNAFQRLVVVYLLYKTTLDQTLLDDQQHVQQENEVHAHGNVVGVDDVVDQEVEHHQIDRDVVEQIVNNQQQGNDVHAHGNMVGIDDLVDQEVGHHQFHGEQIVNNQVKQKYLS